MQNNVGHTIGYIRSTQKEPTKKTFISAGHGASTIIGLWAMLQGTKGFGVLGTLMPKTTKPNSGSDWPRTKERGKSKKKRNRKKGNSNEKNRV